MAKGKLMLNDIEYSGGSSANIDITTTLTEDTISDTSVPSSKVVYDELQKVDAKTLEGNSANDFAKASQINGKLLGTVNGWTALQSVSTDGSTMYRMQLQQNGNVDLYTSVADESGNVTWKKTFTLNSSFLPLAGGTLTGEVFLGSGNGRLNANTLASSLSSINEEGGYTTNSRTLSINNSNGRTIDKCLYIRDIIDGTSTDYTVLHSGNVADYACTTTVADIPFTEVTLDTTKATKNDDSSYIKYCVKNGVCYLSCYGIKLVSLPTNSNHTIISADKLPTPSVYTSCPLQVAAGNESPSTPMFLEVMADGTVRIFSKDSLGAFYGTLAFPVADS